ncbi:MAG: tetratricopeptide repeat protein [Alphaproteobacteria bacterium]|nr:tetratricopeptide repeat protein [Alphaproteobacteria bacterium]
MTTPNRRLAAILAADVVGYSRLMRDNEADTLAALRQYRRELFEPAVTAHRGTVIKSMGDGWLVEFGSVVDAVDCATKVQTALADLPAIRVRMGIHIGDIVHEDEDIYGDGVNIAARLQEIADPGSIVLSAAAHDGIAGNNQARFVDDGTRRLKNIDRPVQTFRWHGEHPLPPERAAAEVVPAGHDDKPSIAVLPFTNMSGDAEQEYFSDGITEDIITALAKYHWFYVVARNTTFTYKGMAVDVAEIGGKLGARYVVEGSVRKVGDRVRVSAQLIDAATGNHLWADRFDRDLADIFAVQDEITRAIVGELTPQFMTAEVRRARRKTDGELDAWDLVMRGREHLWRINREDNTKAQDLFERAIAQAPESSLGRVELVQSLLWKLNFGWTDDRAGTIEQMGRMAELAVTADPDDAYALAALSFGMTYKEQITDAVEIAQRAVAANPNLAIAHTALGFANVFGGNYEEGIESVRQAIAHSPRDPFLATMLATLGIGYYLVERYGDSAKTARQLMLEQPDMPTGYRQLAASLAKLGDVEEARSIIEKEVLRLIPGHTATQSGRQLPFGRNEMARRHWIDGLVDAGLSRG